MMGRRDRLVLPPHVKRSAAQGRRVLTVSESSSRDLVELYGLPESSIGDAKRSPIRIRPCDGGARVLRSVSVGSRSATEEPPLP